MTSVYMGTELQRSNTPSLSNWVKQTKIPKTYLHYCTYHSKFFPLPCKLPEDRGPTAPGINYLDVACTS